LSTLFVEAKFGKIDFYHLYVGSQNAARHTKNLNFQNHIGQKVFTPTKYELSLKRNVSNATISYEFDIKNAVGKGRRSSVRNIGNDVILPPDVWLWRPYSLEKWEHIEVEMDLPAGVNYTVPWKKIGKNLYRIDHSPYNWPTSAAFGSFDVDTLLIPGCTVTVAFFDGNYQTSKKELLGWIKNATLSVTNIYGTYPVENLQILISPGQPRREPVPFGMVVRGGGMTVHFFIDPMRPIKEFFDDWTATHELSHSLIPFIDRNQMWLSEGLATYYQYILMGRDGRMTEQQAWQRIYNGFKKGERNSTGKSIKYTTENMGDYHAYPFIYWCGAAMLLKADVALRQESNGQKSLDWVLKRIKEKLLPATRSWGGKEMLTQMNRTANTSVFVDIYNNYILEKILYCFAFCFRKIFKT